MSVKCKDVYTSVNFVSFLSEEASEVAQFLPPRLSVLILSTRLVTRSCSLLYDEEEEVEVV